MNSIETFSKLTAQDINVLNENKGRNLMFSVIFSLGFAFGLIVFYIGYTETPGAVWIFAVIAFGISTLYLYAIYHFARQISKINQEIEVGIKKR